MSAGLDGSVGVGLGYAAALVQLHLGVGLALLALESAVSSTPALQRQLSGGRWEAGLKAAAAAAGPAPLLAVFALIQASAAPSDLLTWAGLLASTSAVIMGSLHAVLCYSFGIAPPAINARTGDISPSTADETRLAKCASVVARVLSSLRAFGQALLVLASPPTGMQLLCATALLRLALGVHALAGAANALALAPCSGSAVGVRRDVEKVTSVAPVIGSLALMDYIAFGAGSMLITPIHPVLHCMLVVLAQVGLVLAVRTSLDGSVEEPQNGGLDLHFDFGDGKADSDVGAHVEQFRRLVVACLHLTMAIAAARVLSGTFAVSASASALSVEWGEPLFATAGLLSALLVAVHGFDMLLAGTSSAPAAGAPPSAAHTNGCEDPETAGPEVAPDEPAVMGHVKAIVTPVHSLVIALLVAHMQTLTSPGPGALAAILPAAVPLNYGLILAAAAVAAQVTALLAFAASSGGEAAPPFDGTGALGCADGAAPPGFAARLRQAVVLALQGGLALGFASMGAQLWVVIGLTVGPCAYVSLPAESRKVLTEVLGAFGGSLKEVGDYLSSCMQSYLKQKQYEKEVLHARKADEMAAEVERELGTAPGDAKGGKAPKGLKSQAPAPIQAKAGGKAKGASKPKRR